MHPQKRTLTPVTAVLIALAMAGAAACDLAMVDYSEQHTERWEQTYELEPGGRFELRNVNGRVTVQPSDGRVLEVVAERVARAASVDAAKEAIKRVQIEEEATGSSVRITTRIDRSDGVLSRSGSVNVQYTARVPADATIEIATTNGGLEVAGIRGAAKLTTTNGGIKAREMSGMVEARTTNGGLDIDLAAVVEQGARLTWTNGGITLRLPANARATIDASVTNGGIDTGDLRLETIESSRRRLEARLNGGGPRIDVRGTNGGVTLRSR